MSKEAVEKLFEEPDDVKPDGSKTHYYDENDQLRMRVTNEFLEICGMPQRLTNSSMKFEPGLVDFAREWLDQWKRTGEKPGKGFFISGDMTSAEAFFSTLLRSVVNRCGTIACISAMEFGEACKSQDREYSFLNVGCLGILDFGTQHRDREGYWDHFFTKVMTLRFNRGLPTVVTSPYCMDQIRGMYLPNPGALVLPEKMAAHYSNLNLLRILERSTEELLVEGSAT